MMIFFSGLCTMYSERAMAAQFSPWETLLHSLLGPSDAFLDSLAQAPTYSAWLLLQREQPWQVWMAVLLAVDEYRWFP